MVELGVAAVLQLRGLARPAAGVHTHVVPPDPRSSVEEPGQMDVRVADATATGIACEVTETVAVSVFEPGGQVVLVTVRV